MNQNKPEAYLIPARHYEQLLSRLEDAEDRKLVLERSDVPFVEVDVYKRQVDDLSNSKYPSLTLSSGEEKKKAHDIVGNNIKLRIKRQQTIFFITYPL